MKDGKVDLTYPNGKPKWADLIWDQWKRENLTPMFPCCLETIKELWRTRRLTLRVNEAALRI